MSSWHAEMRTNAYSQIVVIPACTVGKHDETEQDINAYVRENIRMKHDLILIGDVGTAHRNPDGTMRIDTMLLIHDDDIGAFAPSRFELCMPFRWFEDVLGNAMEQGTQTYPNSFLCAYPPTWDFSGTKWHEYECYEGTWSEVGA